MKKSFQMTILCGLCCVSLALQMASAQTGRCSQQTIDALENDSEGIRDWARLRTFYHRYSACKIDDADVTTGVSESVARMLSDRWETLRTASSLFKLDPAFERFALAGINITDSTTDLNRIDKLATEHCPANLNELCGKIRKSVRNNN